MSWLDTWKNKCRVCGKEIKPGDPCVELKTKIAPKSTLLFCAECYEKMKKGE